MPVISEPIIAKTRPAAAQDGSRDWPPLPPSRTGLRGRCPRCGQGHLFHGLLALRRECEVCGLDYAFADTADGPAFFVMLLGGVPCLAFAAWLQSVFDPPAWMHLVTTLPVMLLFCLPPLRLMKGWLAANQYFHKAEEVRFAPSGSVADASVRRLPAHEPAEKPSP